MVRSQIMTALGSLRQLLVSAQEETPVNIPEGTTVDEQQAEVTANVELAIRHLEDAAMRVNVAKHTYLGDSTLAFASSSDSLAPNTGAAPVSPDASADADPTPATETSDPEATAEPAS